MASVSKLSWLFCRGKPSLFQNVAIHPSSSNYPGTFLSNFHLSRMSLSSPSTTAAVSTLLLSTFCATTLIFEDFDGSGKKLSWISRPFNGFVQGHFSCTHCDAAVNASQQFGMKDKSKTPVLSATTGDATKAISQQHKDKIQRRVSRFWSCSDCEFFQYSVSSV
jgi:hypothetical protein